MRVLTRWQLSLVVWLVVAVLLACACAASRLRLALRGSVSDELESCVKRGTAAKKKQAVGQSEAAHKAAGGSAADGAAKSDGEADAAGGLPRERSLPSRAFAAHVSLLASRPRLVVLLHAVAVAACVAILIATGGFKITYANNLAYLVSVGRDADEGDNFFCSTQPKDSRTERFLAKDASGQCTDKPTDAARSFSVPGGRSAGT